MLRPPKEERIKYNVDYESDTDFAAHARLLQSIWRDRKGYPLLKLGNFLEIEFAESSKANFLTENIKQLVTREILISKKTGGLIGEPRIWNNLLSSQPLCFNLFGELSLNLELATKFFNRLFPTKVNSVTAVKFEYSPGRSDPKYIGDKSAFDVFIEYARADIRGFIGIEVKYSESLREETKAKANKNYKELYAKLTNNCGLFKPNSVGDLRQPPLSQIWRDHLLSIANKQNYAEGFFVFLFPSKNRHCQDAVDKYKKYLASDSDEQNRFYARHLEDFINVLIDLEPADWTKELKDRYIGNE